MGDLINTAGKGLSDFASGVGNTLAPEIKVPNIPGVNIPQYDASPIDRWLPLLGAVSSTIRAGDPISGFLMGRGMQQDIEHQIAGPYIAQAAQIEGANAERRMRADGIRRAIAASQDPVEKQKLEALLRTIEAGTEDYIKFLYPAPPKAPTTPEMRMAWDLAAANGEDPNAPGVLGKYIQEIQRQEEQRDFSRFQQELAARTNAQRALIDYRQRVGGSGSGSDIGKVNISRPEDKAALQAFYEANPGYRGPITYEMYASYLDEGKRRVAADSLGGSVKQWTRQGHAWVDKNGRPVPGALPLSDAIRDPEIQAVELNKFDLENLETINAFLEIANEVKPMLPQVQKFFENHPAEHSQMFGKLATEKTRALLASQYAELAPFKALMNTASMLRGKQAQPGAKLTDQDFRLVDGYLGTLGTDPRALEQRINEVTKIMQEKRAKLLYQDPRQVELMFRNVDALKRQTERALSAQGADGGGMVVQEAPPATGDPEMDLFLTD